MYQLLETERVITPPETVVNDKTETQPGKTIEHLAEPPSKVDDPEPVRRFGRISREDSIKHIEWAYRNNQPYIEFRFVKDSPFRYAASFYQPGQELKNQDRNKGGILVFRIENNIPILVWENNDHNNGPTYPEINVYDVTGDKKKELIVKWTHGVRSEGVYIYEMRMDDFHLISPEYQPWLKSFNNDTIFPRFNGVYGAVRIISLDGDEIPEIWLPTDLNESGDEVEEHYVAYKWNGTEYVEWKRQKEPFKALEPELSLIHISEPTRPY